ALGKVPTGSAPVANPDRAVDGSFLSLCSISTAGAHYLQIDLGEVRRHIEVIKIFRPNNDGRTYHGTKTQVSADGVKWITVFDSAYEGEYVETRESKTIVVT